MSARDDYPSDPSFAAVKGFHFAVEMHEAMCDEIDWLRSFVGELLFRVVAVESDGDGAAATNALRALVDELRTRTGEAWTPTMTQIVDAELKKLFLQRRVEP